MLVDACHLLPSNPPAGPLPTVHHALPGLPSIQSLAAHGLYLLIAATASCVHLAHLPTEGGSPPQLLSNWEVGTGAQVLAGDLVAGPEPHLLTAVVGAADGSLHLLDVNVALSEPSMASTPLQEYHVGPVTGAVVHPDCCRVVTCGKDGSVRVWAPTEGGSVDMEAVRRFSSPQTYLASCSGRALVAVGSHTGVVR